MTLPYGYVRFFLRCADEHGDYKKTPNAAHAQHGVCGNQVHKGNTHGDMERMDDNLHDLLFQSFAFSWQWASETALNDGTPGMLSGFLPG